MVSFSNVSYKNGRSKQRRIFWIAKKMLKRMETSAVPADIVDTVNKKAFRREQKADFLLKARVQGRYNRTKDNPFTGGKEETLCVKPDPICPGRWSMTL